MQGESPNLLSSFDNIFYNEEYAKAMNDALWEM